MTPSPPPQSAVDQEVARVCLAYTKARQAGEPIRLEELLDSCTAEVRSPLLLGLVKLDWQLRWNEKPRPTVEEYIQRFPEDGDIIRRALSLDSTASTIVPSGGATDMTTGHSSNAGQDLHLKPVDPININRYVIQKQLGEGSYGAVYLAQDSQLNRLVAIKVAREDRSVDSKELAGSLYEARQAVAVESEGIVRVLDIDLEHHPPYIVMEYLEGGSLWEVLKKGALEVDEAVWMTLRLAKALGNAHRKRVFHLDLKPANILIDKDGHPQITDFGFAMHQSHRTRYVGTPTGTPAYMAPEQVRCEANRYDGSTDIWSLGVIFYEMLTGQRPFESVSSKDLMSSILDGRPQPLRQLNPKVPPAIDRICLKCLAVQQLDRYSSTADLVDDLQWWIDEQHQQETEAVSLRSPMPTPTSSVDEQPAIRPQGLRSFDASHADFYLSLLPGPFNRDGIPECVSFWKQRIEATSQDSFSVGVVFGPSGCGKSSLVSAGIVPQLSRSVIPLEVLCTSDRTDVDLQQLLLQQFPALSNEPNLSSAIARLRDDRDLAGGKKTLIILNQFEQFLHTWDEEERNDLLEALRHCDGQHVQCLLTVRADFFHSLSRFMRQVGVQMREGVNLAGIDLFDKKHARHVLGLFGQALGKIDVPMTRAQAAFLEQVVNEIARDGKVICVRLAVIAEMMKHREWTQTEWANVGRAAGVGQSFLDETFTSSTAPPTHREHQEAARRVLNALLPTDEIEIKGDGKSHAELLAASQYKDLAEFEELLGILDDEVRLITPIEQHGGTSEANPNVARHYQLAHDYLVPSLRRWLTEKQSQTRRGRAELLLEQHVGWWTAHPENRFLPSLVGWARIRCWTQPKLWSNDQLKMMRHADRRAVRIALLFLVCCLGMFGGIGAFARGKTQRDKQARDLIETRGRAKIQQLLNVKAQDVPGFIRTDISDTEDDLQGWMMKSLAVQENWRGSFAVLSIGGDNGLRQQAKKNVLKEIRSGQLSLGELIAIRKAIEITGTKELFLSELWDDQQAADSDPTPAAIILAALDADDPNWKRIADHTCQWLVKLDSREYEGPAATVGESIEALKPVGDHLIIALSRLSRQQVSDKASLNATQALAAYANEKHVRNMMLVALGASKSQLAQLLDWLGKEEHRDKILGYCKSVLDKESIETFDPGFDDDSELQALFEEFNSFDGLLDVDHAWCPPIEGGLFERIVKDLQEHGYRPNRIRPAEKDGQLFVAASWLRDNVPFEFVLDIDEKQLIERDNAFRPEGKLPVDLCIVNTSRGTRYSCVWAARIAGVSDARIELSLSAEEVQARVQTNNELNDELNNDQWTVSAIDVLATSGSQEEFALLTTSYLADGTMKPPIETVDLGIAPKLDRAARVPQNFAFRQPNNSPAAAIQRSYFGETHRPGVCWMLEQWNPASVAYVSGQSRDAGSFALRLMTLDSSWAARTDTWVSQSVDVHRDTQYLLSGWIRSEGVELQEVPKHGAHLSIESPDRQLKLGSRSIDDPKWTYVTLPFNSGDRNRWFVGPRLGNNNSTATGKAWFDDLCLIQLSKAEAESSDLDKPEFLTAERKVGNLLWNADFEVAPPVVVSRIQPRFEHAYIELSTPAEHKLEALRLEYRGYKMLSLDSHLVNGELLLASVWSREKAAVLANAAVVYSRLESREKVLDLLEANKDATTRAQWISRLPTTRDQVGGMLKLIQKQTDPAVKQGLLLSIGNLGHTDLSVADQMSLEILQEEAEPGVRAAAEWLAGRLGIPPNNSRKRARDETGTRWTVVETNNHRMIVLNNGERRFAISDSEVTEKQFARFHEAARKAGIKNVELKRGQGDDYAQVNVSFYQAAMYCRWLGEKEGISEDQQYYPSLAVIDEFAHIEGRHAEFTKLLSQRDPDKLTGYRLPTEDEWKYASGETTGDLVDPSSYPLLMSEYGRFSQGTSEQTPAPVRQLKPNLWGLFDIWGNAAEWIDPEPDSNFGPWYYVKGGSFADPPFEATNPYKDHLLNDLYRYGFRIARTWQDPDD